MTRERNRVRLIFRYLEWMNLVLPRPLLDRFRNPKVRDLFPRSSSLERQPYEAGGTVVQFPAWEPLQLSARPMRYKCHYCSKLLVPGTSYTLECECGNCNLGFDRTGKVDHFKITFFEKGKDIFLLKDKHSEAITYGTGRGFSKPWMD